MTKETSAEIASVAGELLNLVASDLVGLDTAAAAAVVAKVHKVSASALSQRDDESIDINGNVIPATGAGQGGEA